jgi:hypothetical protein
LNTRKNRELNLGHAYSHRCRAVYYYRSQVAPMLLQLLEQGSPLRDRAKQQGPATAVALFGSLKGMARRRLGSPRYGC